MDLNRCKPLNALNSLSNDSFFKPNSSLPSPKLLNSQSTMSQHFNGSNMTAQASPHHCSTENNTCGHQGSETNYANMSHFGDAYSGYNDPYGQPQDGEEYRWVCCSCQGDNSCDLNAGCSYCQNHWRNTCCYVYVYKRK
jgi:hypothetical protein